MSTTRASDQTWWSFARACDYFWRLSVWTTRACFLYSSVACFSRWFFNWFWKTLISSISYQRWWKVDMNSLEYIQRYHFLLLFLFCSVFFLLKFGRKMCFSYNLNFFSDDIVISPVYLYWVILQFSFPFLFALISSLFKPSNYCPPPVVLHFYRLVLHRNFKQNHTLARTALDKNNVSRQKQWYARFLWTLISEVINLSNYYPRFYFQRNTKLPSILWNGLKVTNWFKKFLLSFVHDAGHNLHFPVNSFSKSVSIDV